MTTEETALDAAPSPDPSAKYLFLDIDGVLNSNRTSLLKVRPEIDPVAVGMINALIEKGVEVVISSNWRLNNTAEAIKGMLGLTEVIGATPVIPSGCRGVEIATWLLDSAPAGEKTWSFVILDDMGKDAFLPSQGDRLVQTDCIEGFSYRDYLLILDLFELPKPAYIVY